ncbi:SWIM zinc finger family protein [Pseudonocardia xinjiangensis]|uniref:SWIM zinc finger family protein n=1 Tax=Pseudonocardia xinjiangensis TaxID=75289 RepID=UPI0031CE8B93
MSSEMHTSGYRAASALVNRKLVLQTAGGRTARGPSAHPRFFTGFATAPAAAAAGLVALADLARTDFRRTGRTADGRGKGGMGSAYRDPVVTGDGERLRFESLSGCCGVYTRLDVLAPGLDGEWFDEGTTNVDINPALYTALTRVGAGDPLRLSVGPDDLTVATLDGALVEKRVPLPERWLRGLAEVPAVAAEFEPRAQLGAAEARAFFQRLQAGPAVRWVLPAGRSLRASTAAVPGAVCLPAAHRLAPLRPLLRFARSLRLYGPQVAAGGPAACSGWELDLGSMRFWLMLSPANDRGFSGEGRLLDDLVLAPPGTGETPDAGGARGADRALIDAGLIAGLSAGASVLDIEAVAARGGISPDRVRSALAVLAGSGRVGYDCAEAAYFHRELPYAPERLAALHPRLAGARTLAGADAVRRVGEDVEVLSGERRYLVHRTSDGRLGCTCRWWGDHQGGRGPCKHALAVSISEPSFAVSPLPALPCSSPAVPAPAILEETR